MKTRVIGAMDIVANKMTEFGRSRNGLYKALKDNGYNYILERKLPDKSRVITAYKNKNSANPEYAFKVNQDFSMEQKKYFHVKYLLPGDRRESGFQKVYVNGNGKVERSEKLVNRIINGVPVSKEKEVIREGYKKRTQYGVADCVNIRYANLNKSDFPKLTKCVEQYDDGKAYTFLEQADGTRTYVKNINWQNYFFTTKK